MMVLPGEKCLVQDQAANARRHVNLGYAASLSFSLSLSLERSRRSIQMSALRGAYDLRESNRWTYPSSVQTPATAELIRQHSCMLRIIITTGTFFKLVSKDNTEEFLALRTVRTNYEADHSGLLSMNQ